MRPEVPHDAAFDAQVPPAGEGRFRRSIRLTRLAWRLLRTDRAMLALAAMSAVLTIAATVAIFGGRKATGLKRLGRASVADNGRFTFKAKTGTFFRADVIAAPGIAAPLCAQLSPALAPIPCVNPTVNGFAARKSSTSFAASFLPASRPT